MISELRGCIEQLRNGERLSDAAIDEIERTLVLLQSEGWSGIIPVDQAVDVLLRHQEMD